MSVKKKKHSACRRREKSSPSLGLQAGDGQIDITCLLHKILCNWEGERGNLHAIDHCPIAHGPWLLVGEVSLHRKGRNTADIHPSPRKLSNKKRKRIKRWTDESSSSVTLSSSLKKSAGGMGSGKEGRREGGRMRDRLLVLFFLCPPSCLPCIDCFFFSRLICLFVAVVSCGCFVCVFVLHEKSKRAR